MKKLGPWMVLLGLLVLAEVCGAQDGAPSLPPVGGAEPTATAERAATAAAPRSGLRLTWADPDHASGLYYPGEGGKVSILIENPTDAPLDLGGSFKLLQRGGEGATAKPVGITPIAPATIDAGQRAKIDLAVAFTTPGSYEITWDERPIAPPGGLVLECIYAPRGADTAAADSPWIAALPEGAFSAGEFLADYIKRTGIHRYAWNCSWKPGQREVLSPCGRPVTELELAAMVKGVESAGSHIILRLTPQIGAAPSAEATAALNTYVAALLGRCGGACQALAVDVDATTIATQPEVARNIYLAVYAAAKKQNAGIAMLGFCDAAATRTLLSGSVGGAHLDDYVDGLATDAAAAVAALDSGAAEAADKRPVWILPTAGTGLAIAPAAALALGAKTVPVPANDRGLTLHLLGGAVLYQQLHAECPPYIAVFQGNGFAAGVIAGMGAGTLNDRAWRGLLAQARARAKDPTAAAGEDQPSLEVADPDTSFRVVDWAGEPINCRRGDAVRLPLDGRICYLLASGGAEDLVAALRTAELRHWAEVEVTALRVAPGDGGKATLYLRLRNATDHEAKGSVRLAGAPAATDFVPISPGKYIEIALPIEPPAGRSISLDVTTTRQPVRVTIPLPQP